MLDATAGSSNCNYHNSRYDSSAFTVMILGDEMKASQNSKNYLKNENLDSGLWIPLGDPGKSNLGFYLNFE